MFKKQKITTLHFHVKTNIEYLNLERHRHVILRQCCYKNENLENEYRIPGTTVQYRNKTNLPVVLHSIRCV